MAKISKEKISAAIDHYCTIKGISRQELAAQADVSSTTISNISREKWDGISDRIWLTLWSKVNPEVLNGYTEDNDH